MQYDTLKAIAKTLQEKNNSGKTIILDDELSTIDVGRFQTITPESKHRIVFIDGGQADIILTPTFLVQLVRVAEITFVDGKRVTQERHEYHTLTTLEQQGGELTYVTTVTPSTILVPPLKRNEVSLSVGGRAVDITSVGLAVRKWIELEHLKRVTTTAEAGTIIVRDGDLVPQGTFEAPLWSEIRKLTQRGGNVCGLSKTSHAQTLEGGNVQQTLLSLGPNTRWYYPHTHKAGVNIGFTRLHPLSEYVFRIDTFDASTTTPADSLTTILCTLAANACDPFFIGYPYGLVVADQFARVSNQEKEALRVMFMHAAQDFAPSLKQHLHSLDAHSILDRQRYPQE